MSRPRKPVRTNVFSRIRSVAKKRSIPFDLTYEYVFGLFDGQAGKCALTGETIKFADTYQQHERGGSTASLDRIDSQKSYEPGNVQWVHKDVNRMKWTLTQEKFIEICKLVAEKWK